MTNLKEKLIELHLHQFSGRVTVVKDRIMKVIFFRKGEPIYVDSSIRTETLGQMLLEQGRLNEEQYRAVIQKMEETGKRQGEIIVELGYLTGFEVYEALRAQTAKKIENSFLLEGAEITLDSGDQHLKDVPELPIDFFRIYVDSFYSSYVPSDDPPPEDQALLLNSKGKVYLEKFKLQPMESKVIRLLDGKNNHTQVVEMSGFDDAPALIDALRSAKFLEWTAMPKKAPPRFTIPASSVKAAASDPGRKVVEIPAEPKPTNPIYAWALRLDRPYQELLKVTLQTNRAQIKRNYDSIVKELHLDSIEEHYKEEKERGLAEKVLEVVARALAVLSDEKQRQKYAQDLTAKKAQEVVPPPAIGAEVAIQKAKLHFMRKRYDAAEKEIRKAIELMPQDASYHIELAELLMQRAIAEKKEIPSNVEQELRQAVSLNSADFRPFFQLGTLYKISGDIEKAGKFFSKVLELKSNHPQASAELRLINKRLEEKTKSSGSLLGLFKKK